MNMCTYLLYAAVNDGLMENTKFEEFTCIIQHKLPPNT